MAPGSTCSWVTYRSASLLNRCALDVRSTCCFTVVVILTQLHRQTCPPTTSRHSGPTLSSGNSHSPLSHSILGSVNHTSHSSQHSHSHPNSHNGRRVLMNNTSRS